MSSLSLTKLKKRSSRKTKPSLKETLAEGIKNKEWHSLVKTLSGPTRKHSSVNLEQIEKESKAGEVIVVPGKILSKGELKNKLTISALSISELAIEKLKSSKSEFIFLKDYIKKNPKAQGVKILNG